MRRCVGPVSSPFLWCVRSIDSTRRGVGWSARCAVGVGLAIGILVAASPGLCGLPPTGEECIISAPTGEINANPRLAATVDGSFCVVWDADQVKARVFSGSGDIEVQVNTSDAYSSSEPDVTAGSAGEFMIVWSGNRIYGEPDMTGQPIMARRFTTAGVPLSSELEIIPDPWDVEDFTTPQIKSVDASASGDYLLTYMNGYHYLYIYGHRFTPSGVEVVRFTVDSAFGAGWVGRPVAATDGGGNPVVAWQHAEYWDSDILAQEFDAVGTPVSPVITVDLDDYADVQDISRISGGVYVIVYSIPAGLVGQCYAPGGGLLGPQFTISDSGSNARVAMSESGRFLVVWESETSGGNDGSGTSIQGRWFDNACQPAFGSPFQVNEHIVADQERPAVAAIDDETFVAVWQSEVGSASSEVRGRLLVPGEVFRDGFEAGHGARWSYSHTCTVSLLSPNGGESWSEGETVSITWFMVGDVCSPNLWIQLRKGGDLHQYITPVPTENDGVYEWTIPAGLPPGGDYSILVIDEMWTFWDESDGHFSITPAP